MQSDSEFPDPITPLADPAAPAADRAVPAADTTAPTADATAPLADTTARRADSTASQADASATLRSRSPDWRRLLPGAGFFLLISVVVYWRALPGGFIWDDEGHAGHPDVRAPAGLLGIWFDPEITRRYGQYYPLTRSVFWLQNQLWGGATLGFHLVNVLLHGANAFVAWAILKRLSVRGAWLAAAVFALHPVHVESVAWISELKNMLSGFFYLTATLAYIEFALPEQIAGTDAAVEGIRTRRRRAYTCALVLFLCALLSKTVTATLPAAMLLIVWWKRGSLSWKRDVVPTLPFFALGVVLGLAAAWLERTLVGAKGAEFVMTFTERVLVAGRVAWFYLGKLLWPTELTFIYPRWEISTRSAWQFVFPVTAVALVVYLWITARRSKSAQWRGALVALLFFGGTLFPVLGFVDVYPFVFSFVADHFQYLASLGIIALAAALLVMVLKQLALWEKPGGHLVCGALLTTLAVLTWRQAGIYHDSETLWLDTLSKNPKAWIAHTNLGVDLEERGRVDEALECYRRGLALNPDSVHALNNIGSALANQGKFPEAIEYYRRARESVPNHVDTLNNLGKALYVLGRIDEAMEVYAQVVEIDPGCVDAQLVLGSARVAQGRLKEAIVHYEAALEANPEIAQAHFEIANALGTTGKVEEALQHYREALRIKPEYAEALNNMGVFLGGTGRVEQAIANYRRAIEIDPKYVDALINLGGALAHTGRVDEALTYYRRAVEVAPSDVKTLSNFGNALATFGKLDEAVVPFREIVRLQPDDANARVNLGQLLAMQGKVDEAITQYTEGLRADPNSVPALNELAWVLATHADEKVRNPGESLRLAERALELTQARDPQNLETLAAAHAALGNYTKAVEAATKAIEAASGSGRKDMLPKIQIRLALYRAQKPYVETTSRTGAAPTPK